MSKKLTKETVIALASSRNHELLDIDQFDTLYTSVNSKLNFKCHTCGKEFSTSLRSYQAAKKTGCTECKRLITQQTHKGKVLSAETKRKIGELNMQKVGSLTGKTGENHPRYKGGYARDLVQKSNADYAWINAVKGLYGKSCVVTKQNKSVVVHHLDSWNSCPERRYDLTNGVPLSKEIHKQFHVLYGFGNNTETQFADFCTKYYNFDWYSLKKRVLELKEFM